MFTFSLKAFVFYHFIIISILLNNFNTNFNDIAILW